MHHHLWPNASGIGSGRTGANDTQANEGIGFPRIYDLLLQVLTRGRERQYRENLLDIAGVAPGQSVLDIGCGTGTQAIAMHGRSQPGGSVNGVDVSEKMLAVARRKAHRAGVAITFQHADAAQLPFEDRRFDLVTMTTVMHMISPGRRRLVLSEASRILKRGGQLLLVDYAGHREARRHWAAKHGRHGLFDLYDLRESLPDAGFENLCGGPLKWLSLHFLRGTKNDAPYKSA